ncbi:MAG: hypothetical protein Q9160_001105 [Pyrenula sp. 1 TL-2023]
MSTCHTHSASLTTPATVATSAYTYHTQFTTTITRTSAIEVTVNGTSTTSTETIYEETTATTTIPAQTLLTSATVNSTLGTLTITTTFCVSGTPIETFTAYTENSTSLNSNKTSSSAISLYPTQVDCYNSLVTGFTHLLSVIASNNATITLYPSEPATVITTTLTHTDFVKLSPSIPSHTTVSTVASPIEAKTTSRLSSSCQVGETTLTYDQKCAPTNLISAVDTGEIVSLVPYSTIASVHVPDSKDPSACCQLCQDSAKDGCAGLSDQKGGGDCTLYFSGQRTGNVSTTGGGQCGVAFDYWRQYHEPEANLSRPLLVQSGCGIIRPEGVEVP